MRRADNDIIIYKAPGGATSLEVKLKGESVWLNLNQIAQRRSLTEEEATSLLRVVADYAFALDLLDAYARQTVKPARGSGWKVTIRIDEGTVNHFY